MTKKSRAESAGFAMGRSIQEMAELMYQEDTKRNFFRGLNKALSTKKRERKLQEVKKEEIGCMLDSSEGCDSRIYRGSVKLCSKPRGECSDQEPKPDQEKEIVRKCRTCEFETDEVNSGCLHCFDDSQHPNWKEKEKKETQPDRCDHINDDGMPFIGVCDRCGYDPSKEVPK